MPPVISIIIPTYKAGNTIGEALASVWTQAFDDYEVIVVDDCSPDGTVAAIGKIVGSGQCAACPATPGNTGRSRMNSEQWAVSSGQEAEDESSVTCNLTARQPGNCMPNSHYSNIPTLQHSITPLLQPPDTLFSGILNGHPFRLLRTPRNLGPAGARNTGIAVATGEWLAFLDGDDIWTADRLTMTMACIRAVPEIGMWCGEIVPVSGSNFSPQGTGYRVQGSGFKAPVSSSQFPVSSTSSWRRIALEEFIDSNPVATSTVTIKRSVFDAAGGFDSSFRGPEDYDLWMRVAGRAPIGFIRRPLAGYRHNVDGLSMRGEPFLREILRVIDKAFAPGGALQDLRGERRARAYQYFCTAWVAGEQGRRDAAMRFYLLAMINWPFRFVHAPVPRFGRLKLLWRIVRSSGK